MWEGRNWHCFKYRRNTISNFIALLFPQIILFLFNSNVIFVIFIVIIRAYNSKSKRVCSDIDWFCSVNNLRCDGGVEGELGLFVSSMEVIIIHLSRSRIIFICLIDKRKSFFVKVFTGGSHSSWYGHSWW